jgi:alanine-synthesizing transaminase
MGDVLVNSLNLIRRYTEKAKGTIFVWASIPEEHRAMGSVDFLKILTEKAEVVVSPTIGFGEYGDDHIISL